jgi:hypothetical protein
MGTKISALTETGSAPTGAYYPLEYENANYKISTETLRGNLRGKYTADWAVSHGGVTVANGATLTITHNLGTTDICVSAFANASASDVGADGLDAIINADPGGLTYGVFITSIIDENSFVLQLADTGYGACDSSGSAIGTPFTDKFLKVVVLAAGNPPTNALYDTGWIDGTEASSPLSSQVSGAANFTLTHNAGRDNYVAQWQVADDGAGTNRVVIDYSDQGNSRRGGRMYELEADSLKFRTYPTYTTFSAGGEGTYNSMDNRYVRFILSAAAGSSSAGGGAGRLVTGYAEHGLASTSQVLIADLGNESILTCGASVEFRRSDGYTYATTVNGTLSKGVGPGGFADPLFAGGYQMEANYVTASDAWAGGLLQQETQWWSPDAFSSLGVTLTGNALYLNITAAHSGQIWSSYLTHGT